ncbi:MAG: YdcF family protein [Lachnospiraceae bacterium]|nr:YdcF family protein [Lachnospiraceae bacterium]
MLRTTIYFLRTAGVLSIIYFLIITVYSGIRTSFLWIWPFVAICSFSFSALLDYAAKQANKNWTLAYRGLLTLFWLGFCLLFFILCKLVRTANTPPSQDAEYVIILGAQVRGSTPSLSLQARIDTAAEYLNAHPDCTAICSGGQGEGENLSEAAVIRQGLLAHGIAEERILMEADSTTTVENLLFCSKLLPATDTPVILVTNNFHCYRAGLLAKKLGYETVSTLGANRFLATTPHYYFREFFALVKEFIVGNI